MIDRTALSAAPAGVETRRFVHPARAALRFRKGGPSEVSFSHLSANTRKPRAAAHISAAAASVNVTIKMFSSEQPSQTSARQRSTNVRVLPVPAPATTSTLPRARMAAL